MDIFKSFECSKMKNICRQMQLVTKKNRNLTPHLQIIQAIDYYTTYSSSLLGICFSFL